MSKPLTEDILGIHLDVQDMVWTGRPGQTQIRTNLSSEHFVNQADLSGTIRVLGLAKHSALLCRLHNAVADRPDCRLEVARPSLVSRWSTTQQKLTAIVNSARLPPSLGGWHQFTDVDLATYKLRMHQDAGLVDTPGFRLLVLRHPVRSLASFIPTLDHAAFGKWLACVLDPRWYVDESNPDRTSKLEQFLGLRPDVQRAVLRDQMRNNASDRCRLTRQCWLPDDIGVSSDIQIDDPRQFLFRVLRGSQRRDAAIGLVRASQVFTQYVRAIWLNALSVGTTHENQLFDPEQFFKTRLEREAFKQFVASCSVQ